MSELKLELPDDVIKRLETEAKSKHKSVADIAREAIELYFDDEPTKEELLKGLREAFQDALADRVYPIDTALEELRQEIEADADKS